MPETALGYWLKGLREAEALSLRDLAQRGNIDHAYIYRLETGAKETPSEEAMNKLVAALKPSERDAKILWFLVANRNVDTGLLAYVRDQAPETTFDEFHMLTTVVNRGTRPDYATSLARIRRFMQE